MGETNPYAKSTSLTKTKLPIIDAPRNSHNQNSPPPPPGRNMQHTQDKEAIILVDLENNEFEKDKETVNADTEVKQVTPANVSEDMSVDETDDG